MFSVSSFSCSKKIDHGFFLRNVLNLYKMSTEEERGIVSFLHGGMDLFWNDPLFYAHSSKFRK